ncbi:MAG: flagellar biosynthesis regulator FlaF [Phenylobacterium sp.]|uniref:flagellar biosynthesis regulator FlaF n=1 Tax=Phenylobacterium sp. TaxID=1871053 RepID=UPI00271AD7CE|nr:flagellar biosynthesis regulator FlaF [Phenylobacterium sp.]MDO9432827.1 flagellar biosynthesis regulator FlaF [Phenylobacterium sp.]
MSLRAYQQAATRAEAPKDTEYRLFGQATRALIAASEVPISDLATRIAAIDWNRRLWSTLALDCNEPGNALPSQVRANIISLSLFVGRHSSEVMRGQDDFETLIEINKIMMQALGHKAEPPVAA